MSGYFDALNRRRDDTFVVPVQPVREERRSLPLPAAPRLPARVVSPSRYEELRENLLVAGNGTPLKTIVFAGCRGQEGCTDVVRGLAQAFAASGMDVLVVDGDRRTTDLVPDAVTSGPDLDQLIQTRTSPSSSPFGPGRLTVVPRRATMPEKEPFYGAPEFVEWLTAQRAAHDYVLLDAPPLLSFADATLLARVSDGAVIVAEAEATDRDSLVRASEQLKKAGVRVLGVVLNRARNPVPMFLRPHLRLT